MARPRTRDDALKSVRSKAKTVARFMNSPVGEKVIKLLDMEFSESFGKDPHDTYRKLGNREVIDYLRQLQRIDEREDQNETI